MYEKSITDFDKTRIISLRDLLYVSLLLLFQAPSIVDEVADGCPTDSAAYNQQNMQLSLIIQHSIALLVIKIEFTQIYIISFQAAPNSVLAVCKLG